MKRTLLTVLSLIIIYSCSNNKKENEETNTNKEIENNWKQEHKDNFIDACIKAIPGNGINYSQKKQYCTCSLGRMMEKYSTAEEMDKAALKWTLEDMIKQAEPCVDFLK